MENIVKEYATLAANDVKARGIGPHEAAEELIDQLPAEELRGLAVDGFAEVVQSVLFEWRRRDRKAWEAEHREELAERQAALVVKAADTLREEAERMADQLVEQRVEQHLGQTVDQYLLDKLDDIMYAGADGRQRSLLAFRPEDAVYQERKFSSTAASSIARQGWFESLAKAFKADPDAAVTSELPASVLQELGTHAVEVWTKDEAEPDA